MKMTDDLIGKKVRLKGAPRNSSWMGRIVARSSWADDLAIVEWTDATSRGVLAMELKSLIIVDEEKAERRCYCGGESGCEACARTQAKDFRGRRFSGTGIYNCPGVVLGQMIRGSSVLTCQFDDADKTIKYIDPNEVSITWTEESEVKMPEPLAEGDLVRLKGDQNRVVMAIERMTGVKKANDTAVCVWKQAGVEFTREEIGVAALERV